LERYENCQFYQCALEMRVMEMSEIDHPAPQMNGCSPADQHDRSENTAKVCIDCAAYRPQSTMDRPGQTKTNSVVLIVTEKRIVPFG